MTTQTDHRDAVTILHRTSAEAAGGRTRSVRSVHARLRQEALERLLEAEEYAVLADASRHVRGPDATRKELTTLIREQADIVDSELVLLQEALEASVDVYAEHEFLRELLGRVIDTQRAVQSLRASLDDVH